MAPVIGCEVSALSGRTIPCRAVFSVYREDGSSAIWLPSNSIPNPTGEMNV